MKINKSILLANVLLASSLSFGAVMLSNSQKSLVTNASNEVIKDYVSVDVNKFWGDGEESYKVATYFYNNDNNGWSDLVSVNSPDRYIKMPYEINFVPTRMVFYRYNINFSKENWESDPKGENPSSYGWSESPVITKTFDLGYLDGSNNANINHIILSSDTYGLNDIPSLVHQIYLPKEDTWSSDTYYLNDIYINELHHAEYSLELTLKRKDSIRFEKYLGDIYKDNIVLGEGMDEVDVSYWQDEDNPASYKGLDINTKGIYTFKLDYYANSLLISKRPMEKNETPIVTFIAIVGGSIAAIGLTIGLILIFGKKKRI